MREGRRMSDKDETKKELSRQVEIIRGLGSVLEAGEIAFVVTKGGKAVYAFPSETEAKARMGELSIDETFNILAKAQHFVSLALMHHERNVREASPKSNLVTPVGPGVVGAH